MRIEFLGTAAAEACPNPFCNCENCQQARVLGGKNIRKRASLLINDDLIIDFGPDIHTATAVSGRSFAGVRYALQTHPHYDHLCSSTFYMRSNSTLPEGIAPMIYACSAGTVAELDRVVYNGAHSFLDEDVRSEHSMEFLIIHPWQSFALSHYQVHTVAANHATADVEPMLFAIRDTRDGGTVFYGTDTGSLPADTWPRLHAQEWRFDVLILDHTRGYRTDLAMHLGEKGFITEVAAARQAGVIDDQSKIIATHFAHHSHRSHEELANRCATNGYEPAWDGLAITTQGR